MDASHGTIDRTVAVPVDDRGHLTFAVARTTVMPRGRRHPRPSRGPITGPATGTDPNPDGPVEPRPPAVAREWPFLGRDDELGRLREIIAAGERSGAMLAGPMGVGKTRLATEALTLAERAGLVTVPVRATRAAAALPFGAFAQLLAPGDLTPDVADDRAWLLRRMREALARRAGDRRLALLVDDAHLLDDSSATLVHQLVDTGAAFVLATVRTGERAPDPVLALWKDRLAERIELGGLPAATVAELLPAALGGPVDPDTVATLVARSEGNVLFLHELVRGAVQDGTLVDDGDGWHLHGELSPSNRLIELVETRLAGLRRAERDLLEILSVGDSLGHAELTELADPEAAEGLERRGFLSSRMEGRRLEVRLAHPVYGDVVRAGLSALRSRAIARALAEVVEATGARRQEDTLRVACWRLAGGGGRPETLVAGAVAARWHHDHPLAERLARAALDAGGGFEAALAAAQLASLQGRTAEAEAELAALADRASDDAQRGLVALARADNSVTWTGVDDTGILDQAQASITDSRWRDEIKARRLSLLLNSEGPRAAAEAAAPLLRQAQGEALAFACISGSYSLIRLGCIDDALDAAARGQGLRLASPSMLAWPAWWHEVNRCRALYQWGRLDEAEELALRRYREAVEAGSSEAQAAFALLPATAAAERGRVDTTSRLALEAAEIGRRLDRPVLVGICHIYAALAFAFGGRPREAEESLAAFDALGHHVPPHHEVDLLRARAWTAAAAGDVDTGCDRLRRAAKTGDEIGDLVGEVAALHGLARLGHADEVRHSLAEVARHVDGPLVAARARHAELLARHDPEGLEAVSRDFEAMGADLLAAETAANAALVRQGAGDMRAATADRRRAGVLTALCEGGRTPALEAVEAQAVLTAAERETALLAAAGHTNREIADQLYLSVRTVGNRLQRVYEKLGISRRTELAQALDRESSLPPR